MNNTNTANNRQTPVRAHALRGTLGFLFSPNKSQVLLILKNRPEWAAGKYNGVGGKHEERETDQVCLSREFLEEAGLKIAPESWQTVAHIEWRDWDGAVLTAIWSGDLAEAKSMTDEPVSWQPVADLPENCMPNLFWMIPLAKDALREKSRQYEPQELYIQVKYRPLFE